MNSSLSVTGLGIFSGVATAIGLAAFLNSQAHAFLPPQFAPYVAGLSAVIASAIAQGLIRVNWFELFAKGFSVLVVVALAASTLSALGAAASFSMLGSAADMQAFKQRAAGAQVSGPIQEFADGFSILRVEMNQLSEHAVKLAEAEVRGEITCENDMANSDKCGPKCRLRNRHASFLTEAATSAGSLESEARELAIEFASTADVDAQQALYREAAELRGNIEQPRIAATLRRLAQELRAPATDPETGLPVDCRDSRFAEQLDSFAQRIETRISIPMSAPMAETAGINDAAVCIVKRVGEMLGLWEACELPMSDSPIWIAVALEFLLVVLIYYDVKRKRKLGQLRTTAEEFMAAAQARSPRERLFLARLLTDLDVFVWDAGHDGVFIAVPLDGPTEAYRDASRYVRMLNAPGPQYLGVKMSMVEPAWFEARRAVFQAAEHFNLHPLPEETHELRRRAERDLSATQGDDHAGHA